MKCPGQDKRYWTEEDVFEITCPACGSWVELFRSDTTRRCPNCNFKFKNPRLDLGCAEWCAQAKQCLATIGNLNQDKQMPGMFEFCPPEVDE